jgi:predicted Mrr-cat superfamily restriction endonuclease
MTRYWAIAPYDSTESKVFDKVWDYDFKNSTIAVGWSKLGDISQIKNIDELRLRHEKAYPEDSNITRTRDCNAIWNFYYGMQPGDIIIARRGRKKIVGIGTVTEPKKVYYKEEEGKKRVDNLTTHYYPNFMKVNWEKKEIDFGKMVFGIYTMDEISEEKYNNIIKGQTPEPTDEILEAPTEEQKVELYMEKYLEEIIVRNFGVLFKNQLTLYKDEEGNIGQQYPIIGVDGKEIGQIDILAIEPKTNSYVVIELKKGRESGKVVGQILTYMGWVQDNLCKEGQKVKGLIVCKEKDERLKYALKLVSDFIDLKFYDLGLKLNDKV